MTAQGETNYEGMIGQKGDIVHGPYPVSLASIGYLAEALEDERLADQVASGGKFAAPRSFVTIASRVPNWRRKKATGPSTFMQAVLLPLPANSAVNMSVDQVYFAPLYPGDTISSQSTITGIVPKKTRLGEGFIITEDIDHLNQNGVLVARTINTLLRFVKPESSDKTPPKAAEPLPAKPLVIPASDFPPVSMPITMTALAKGAAAVRDFSPLHHDVDFARSVGHPTAFLSYSHQMSFVVRALGEWLGGDDRLQRLKLSMKTSIYLGRTCVCTGVRQKTDNPQPGIETIEVTLTSEDGTCTPGIAEVQTAGAR